MGLLDLFRSSQPSSATVAKERLRILVAHERSERNRPSYLPMLEKELLEVIRKYVHVEKEAVSVNVEREDSREVLELNVILPPQRGGAAAS